MRPDGCREREQTLPDTDDADTDDDATPTQQPPARAKSRRERSVWSSETHHYKTHILLLLRHTGKKSKGERRAI